MSEDPQDDWEVASGLVPCSPSAEERPAPADSGESKQPVELKPCYVCERYAVAKPIGKLVPLCLSCAHRFLTGARGGER